jgi:hypothetical protein
MSRGCSHCPTNRCASRLCKRCTLAPYSRRRALHGRCKCRSKIPDSPLAQLNRSRKPVGPVFAIRDHLESNHHLNVVVVVVVGQPVVNRFGTLDVDVGVVPTLIVENCVPARWWPRWGEQAMSVGCTVAPCVPSPEGVCALDRLHGSPRVSQFWVMLLQRAHK